MNKVKTAVNSESNDAQKCNTGQYSLKPNNAAALSGWIGLLYALKIWTIYGLMANTPVNSMIRKMKITMMNGCKVRFRLNSAIFSRKLGAVSDDSLFDFSFTSCIFCNSGVTEPLNTQPRNQHNDFSASSRRPFDISHWGVSGICGNEYVD